ncbi:hypothetical protein LN050_09050 [Comamonadaceae bacterium M7527]|nr:hypothetical protein LN050_09050 [Comamonadaceae bacterium M7527]
MKPTFDLTVCLTIGRRPELLRETLVSMGPLIHDFRVLAVNDFGDEATNEVFRAYCPKGELLSLSEHVGHHRAVDHMYDRVKTEFILHCEDDWKFHDLNFLGPSIDALHASDCLSMVCLRSLSDFQFTNEDFEKKLEIRLGDNRLADMTGLHDQWHGYTFNPHLVRAELWRGLGGFSSFKKERHISRHLRKKGLKVGYLQPGFCCHIGDGASVANPPKRNLLERLRYWFKS